MSQNIYSEDSYNVLNYANSQRYFRMNFLQFEQSQNAVCHLQIYLVGQHLPSESNSHHSYYTELL